MPNNDPIKKQLRREHNNASCKRYRKIKHDKQNQLYSKLPELIKQNQELKALEKELESKISKFKMYLTAFQAPKTIFVHLGPLSHVTQTRSIHRVTGKTCMARAVNVSTNLSSSVDKSTFFHVRETGHTSRVNKSEKNRPLQKNIHSPTEQREQILEQYTYFGL